MDIIRSKVSQNKELKNHLLCTMNFDLTQESYNEYFCFSFIFIDMEVTNKTNWKGQEDKLSPILSEIRAEI